MVWESTSRQFWRTLAVAAFFAAAFITAAKAETIGFDDLPDPSGDPQGVGLVPSTYHNLQWNNAYYIKPSVAFMASGYGTGMMSSPHVGFNGFGAPADITALAMTGSLFDFTSGYFTGAFNDGMTVTLTGIQADSTVLVTNFIVNTTGPTFVSLNWTDLVSFTLSSAGGTQVIFIGSGTQVAFDDLVINAFICRTSASDDTCLVTSATPQTTFITDADGGTDTLQVGGTTNFNFDVSNIGPSGTFRNFETFQKINTSNVTLTGTAGTGANWNVIGGTLTASGGNSIGNTSAVTVGAAGTLALSASETIGSLAGSGALSLGANTLTTGGNNASTTFSGTSSGSGGLTKTGTGTFTMTGAQGYLGQTTVSQGTMIVNGSLADGLLVSAGATFGGAATVTGNVTNLGTISPGNSPGPMNFNANYMGGGSLLMDVEFDNAGSPINGSTHDFINIAGNVLGATTTITIVPDPPSGNAAATSGNGIELIRVGGTVAANQFALSGPVVQGGYQYFLQFVQTGGPDSFYLQSAPRDDLWAQIALLSGTQAMTQRCFRSSERGVDAAPAGQRGRAWVKYAGGSFDSEADTGLVSDQDYGCGSGGIDFLSGPDVRVGLSGGYGNSSVEFETPLGMGQLDGDQSIVEGYASYANGRTFMNLSVGYATTEWTFDGPLISGATATADGIVGSMQLGMRWPVGEWRIGLMGEIDYDDASCGDTCFIAGTSEEIGAWTGKAQVRVDGRLASGRIMPYIAIAYSDSLDGGNRVSVGSAFVEADTASGLFDAEFGVTALIGERVAFFANAGITEGVDSDVSGVSGQGGFKVYW